MCFCYTLPVKDYDVIIVGAGPAGIFAALELVTHKKGLKVLLLDMGSDLRDRKRSDIFHGFGGAGTFSDGKLNLSSEVGGVLGEYLGPEELYELIEYADGLYLKYGAPRELKGTDKAAVSVVAESAAKAGLKLVSFPIRHLGTDRCMKLLENLRSELEGRVDMLFGTAAEELIIEGGELKGIKANSGQSYSSEFVILAPGRVGSSWLEVLMRSSGLSTSINPVDVGVRVELPAEVFKHVTDVVHEGKFLYISERFNDPVRTFCMNPYGVVVEELHEGFSTVNGHSYSVKKSEKTNFAVLVSTTFTEPFKEPIAYGRYIATLANLLGEGIIVQTLGDLTGGRRSTLERISSNAVTPTLSGATPGDLSFVLPYRHLTDIIEFLAALDKVAPGTADPSTLLYGVEVKFYSMRLALSPTLETGIKNLFAAGDGAGITRGIVQASVSGIVAARGVIESGGSGARARE